MTPDVVRRNCSGAAAVVLGLGGSRRRRPPLRFGVVKLTGVRSRDLVLVLYAVLNVFPVCHQAWQESGKIARGLLCYSFGAWDTNGRQVPEWPILGHCVPPTHKAVHTRIEHIVLVDRVGCPVSGCRDNRGPGAGAGAVGGLCPKVKRYAPLNRTSHQNCVLPGMADCIGPVWGCLQNEN